MDKITKALEQARQKRHSLGSEVRAAEPANARVARQHTETVLDRPAKTIKSFHPDISFLENHRILNKDSSEDIIQPYKVLRTRLMHIMKEKGWTNIAVTSPNKNEGKSTVAINLAISIAASQNNNAALLDLDLWEPTVHTYFDYAPEVGLEAYFEKNQSLESLLVTPEMDGLAIAPASRPLKESSEYLSTGKSIELLSDAKSIMPDTIVVADLPPLLVSDDAISFFPYVDAVLLVIREGKTTKHDIEQALELLENVNIAGIILNDTADESSYGYYYQ
jgi:capsular exopolysaccharide synthesis family protein